MIDDEGAGPQQVTRRALFGGAAAAATAAAMLPGLAAAQAPADPNSAPLKPTGVGGPINSTSLDGQMPQGGTGPIRVLFLSAYHPFDRENLFRMLDGFGREISWTHVEHPAAEAFFDPALAADFDVFLFYDAFAGRKITVGADGKRVTSYPPPSARLQANLKKLLQNGDKGFVMFHHALASWVHSWPAGVNGSNAYVEMMGGAADWGMPLANLRGKTYPNSGYRQGTEQRISIVDRNHPITQGVEDFDMIDETYLCPIFEDSVQPLLRTNFVPTEDKFRHAPNGANVGAGHPPGSQLTGWYKAAENTPLVYLQHGHDNNAWGHPSFRRLMLNAIKWAASPEAKSWARAHSKRIFA